MATLERVYGVLGSLAAATCLGACGPSGERSGETGTRSSIAVEAAQPVVAGRYESTGIGPVNAWWLETPDGGLVLVDTQRSADQARAAVQAIQATGKPVRAILITHPHPDHVTGLSVFKAAFPEARVHAQSATRDEFRDDSQKLLSLEGAALPPLPDVVVSDGERLTLGGLEVVARAMGAGESVGMTTYWLPGSRTLLTGDLATPGYVPFMAEARTGPWLEQLAELKQSFPADARVLPGHGPEGRLGVLADAQAAYLSSYRTELTAAVQSGSEAGQVVSAAERSRVVAAVERRHPTKGGVAGMPLEQLHALNAAGVARELTGAPPRPAGAPPT